MLPLARSVVRTLLVPKPSVSCVGTLRFSSDAAPEEKDEISVEDLKPSREFVKKLPRELKKAYEKTLSELEIFVYMGKFVPNSMTDDDWSRTLRCESLNDKIGFWEYLAITKRRHERKEKRLTQNTIQYKEFLETQKRNFDAGWMGYGPEMHQLISNPMRNSKRVNNCQGAKILSSMIAGAPKVALDLQFIAEMPFRQSAELGNQMQYVISENFSAKNPLCLDFVNVPSVEFSEKWLAKSVGYYTGTYVNQTILPDFSTKGSEILMFEKRVLFKILGELRESSKKIQKKPRFQTLFLKKIN